MQFYSRADADKMMITIAGSMYIEDAAVFRERIMDFTEQGYAYYQIDLSELEYIDSSGLGVMVALQKKALLAGGRVCISGLQGDIKELFVLSRLTNIFEIIE